MGRLQYTPEHIRRLRDELTERYSRVLAELPPVNRRNDPITVDGSAIRMAVGDFKVVLDEIKRLK
jgi:hypothetical protein